ncbi:MAG: PilN domain-containing protein [Fimbriimonadaceae bacterium]
MKRSVAPTGLIEWSPGRVRACTMSGPIVEGRGVGEVVAEVPGLSMAGVALHRRLAFVRDTHTPPTDAATVRQALYVQMEQLFPVPAAELAFDFAAEDRIDADGRPTTVVAARADTIREAAAELGQNGCRGAWYVPAGVGAVYALDQAGLADGLVMDRNGTEVSFDVVRGGRLRHSRSIPVGDDREAVVAELKRTVAALDCADLKVYVCPAVRNADLGEALETSTLQALGRHTGADLDLELPEVQTRREKALQGSRRRLAGLLWVAALVLGGLAWLDRDEAAALARERNAKHKSTMDRLDSTAGLLSERRVRLEEVSKLVAVAAEPAQTPSDVVRYVTNSAPSGLWFSGLTYERGRPLVIRGNAMDREAISKFAANLAASDRYRDVTIVFANDAKIEDTPVIQFSISSRVVGNLPLVEKKASVRRRG